MVRLESDAVCNAEKTGKLTVFIRGKRIKKEVLQSPLNFWLHHWDKHIQYQEEKH